MTGIVIVLALAAVMAIFTSSRAERQEARRDLAAKTRPFWWIPVALAMLFEPWRLFT